MMKRQYTAWTIFARIVSQGKPISGYDWFPMYKSIEGMLPFFTTKRQAQKWLSARGTRSGRVFKYRVERVAVEATAEQFPDDHIRETAKMVNL